MRTISVAAVFLACSLTSGCLGFSVGGGSSVDRAVTPPTLGREFEDLMSAYKSGALTKEEYESQKQKLIAGGRRFE
jgi:hypothetical protein